MYHTCHPKDTGFDLWTKVLLLGSQYALWFVVSRDKLLCILTNLIYLFPVCFHIFFLPFSFVVFLQIFFLGSCSVYFVFTFLDFYSFRFCILFVLLLFSCFNWYHNMPFMLVDIVPDEWPLLYNNFRTDITIFDLERPPFWFLDILQILSLWLLQFSISIQSEIKKLSWFWSCLVSRY